MPIVGPPGLIELTWQITGKKRGSRLKGEQLQNTTASIIHHPHGDLQAHLVVAQADKTEEQLALRGAEPTTPHIA